jgi:hypothetical protein
MEDDMVGDGLKKAGNWFMEMEMEVYFLEISKFIMKDAILLRYYLMSTHVTRFPYMRPIINSSTGIGPE